MIVHLIAILAVLASGITASPAHIPHLDLTRRHGTIPEVLLPRDFAALNTHTNNVLDITRVSLPSPQRRRQVVVVQEPVIEQVYTATVTVGGKDFTLMVDTGSDLLWVPSDNVECTNLDHETCRFNHTLTAPSDETLGTFEYPYVDKSHLSGHFIERPVSLGGIHIDSQVIGLATKATIMRGTVGPWDGVVGFRPYSTEQLSNGSTVQPLWASMMASGQLSENAFSIALMGSIDEDGKREEGLLGLGGIPKAIDPIKSTVASVPMADNYSIVVDSFHFQGTKDISLAPEKSMMIADSGTFLTYVPKEVADALFDLLPGTGSKTTPCPRDVKAGTKCYRETGEILMPCDQKPPEFGITIDKQLYMFSEDNMIVNYKNSNICTCGVAKSTVLDQGLIGTSFMKNNILVVYDFTDPDAHMMHFAHYNLAE